MTNLAHIANHILSGGGLLLSAVGVPELYRLRREFLKKIGDRETSTDDASLFDAAIGEVEEAIEMFERSAMETPEMTIGATFDKIITKVADDS